MNVYTVYGIKDILLLLKRIIRDLEHNLNLLSNPCHNSFEPWIVVPLVLIFGGNLRFYIQCDITDIYKAIE